ncbi:MULTISPECIES: hypothetical protein [Pantoea]|uniref:hypothetical protein n=1 Tax=Pantoea TaxID=53335 RepID=UPI00257DE28A|nr:MULTISPECIES: hypothetical protein [Pantoea]MDU5474496.1 hypothetical protein [Pantoea sp.]
MACTQFIAEVSLIANCKLSGLKLALTNIAALETQKLGRILLKKYYTLLNKEIVMQIEIMQKLSQALVKAMQAEIHSRDHYHISRHYLSRPSGKRVLD